MSESVLSCRSVSQYYQQGDKQVEVLQNLNFELSAGQRVAIMGSSGAGKSTLLNLLGGLDNPTEGTIYLKGQAFNILNADQRAALRNKHLGFVYQFHHLLPEFNALENAAMPALIGGVSKRDASQRAEQMLVGVGLEHRLKHKPAQMSGGERQRVAIARALVMKPACVLLDEPTGNLDAETAEQVLSVINEVSSQEHVALVVVTHDAHLAAQMDKTLILKDGQLGNQM